MKSKEKLSEKLGLVSTGISILGVIIYATITCTDFLHKIKDIESMTLTLEQDLERTQRRMEENCIKSLTENNTQKFNQELQETPRTRRP